MIIAPILIVTSVVIVRAIIKCFVVVDDGVPF
jgi:hypothetical protein